MANTGQCQYTHMYVRRYQLARTDEGLFTGQAMRVFAPRKDVVERRNRSRCSLPFSSSFPLPFSPLFLSSFFSFFFLQKSKRQPCARDATLRVCTCENVKAESTASLSCLSLNRLLHYLSLVLYGAERMLFKSSDYLIHI